MSGSRRITRSVLAGLLMLWPMAGFALEAWPTAADLSRGIEATFSTGDLIVCTAGEEPGTAVGQGGGPVGATCRRVIASGGFSLSADGPTADGQAYDIRFDDRRAAGEWPRIEPGKHERIEYPMIAPDPRPPMSRQWVAGDLGPVTRLGCTYDGCTDLVADETKGGGIQRCRYLPEFGIRTVEWQEREGVPRREMALTGIRVLP